MKTLAFVFLLLVPLAALCVRAATCRQFQALENVALTFSNAWKKAVCWFPMLGTDE